MAEYIKRESVKESINSLLDMTLKFTHSPIEIKQLVFDVIDEERAVEVQPVNHWISVKDRLPEIGKSVLVIVSINAKVNLPLCTDLALEMRIGWLDDNGKWGLQFNSADRDEILYWMPLPEPPKDGDINE